MGLLWILRSVGLSLLVEMLLSRPLLLIKKGRAEDLLIRNTKFCDKLIIEHPPSRSYLCEEDEIIVDGVASHIITVEIWN